MHSTLSTGKLEQPSRDWFYNYCLRLVYAAQFLNQSAREVMQESKTFENPLQGF